MKNKGKINVRGKFMKKINKLIATLLVGVVGVLGIGTVYADEPSSGGTSSTTSFDGGKVTVDCEKYDLAVGASTTCTVYVTPTKELAAFSEEKQVIINMVQSQYITINNIKVNTAGGFAAKSSLDTSDKTIKSHSFELTHTGTLTESKKTEILSFTLKLEEAAKNLSIDECGELCVTGAVFNMNTTKVKGTITVGDNGKACPNLIITEQKCEGSGCNPETGEFMNYAVIAGVAGVALVVIAVVTRKKKFYTV